MGLLSTLLGLGGKALEKILPDRAKLQQQHMEINAETERASNGRMTPRKLFSNGKTAAFLNGLRISMPERSRP